jgi:hypothetical protein
VDRNRLAVGAIVVVVLIVVLGYGLVQRQRDEPQASQRSPLAKLAYCSAEDIRPCIVSFSLDSAGNMLINILTGIDFPAFYLKIIHEAGESIYECQRVENFHANRYCKGQEIQVGEILQFLLISKSDETLLAEGNFAIVGLALPTPEDQPTVSPTATVTGEQPLETVTAMPTPVQSTPSPSYPNPPYPNPSPSYP